MVYFFVVITILIDKIKTLINNQRLVSLASLLFYKDWKDAFQLIQSTLNFLNRRQTILYYSCINFFVFEEKMLNQIIMIIFVINS